MQAGILELRQHGADAVVGGGGLVACAVVAGFEAVGELFDKRGVVAACEDLQGFGEWRADDVGVDGAYGLAACAGEGVAEAGENGRRGVDQGAVEVEQDVAVAGHGVK